MDLFEDQEEGLKYRIMFSISVPLAFRTQGFATRAFLGTTTGALSPKQNVSYEHTVSPIAQRNVIPLGFYCIHKKYHLRYYFFSPGVFFLDSKNLLIILMLIKFWIFICVFKLLLYLLHIFNTWTYDHLKIKTNMILIQH